VQRRHRPGREEGLGCHAELEQADPPAGKRLGVDRPLRRRNDALDVFGELRFRPDDALDAEVLAQALAGAVTAEELFFRDEADRPLRAQPRRQRAPTSAV
jgi:hypothetical protein